VAVAFLLLAPELAFSQWVFVARHVIGKIEQVTQNQSTPDQPSTEVVTVILDAPAQRVFDVAIKTIQEKQNVSIINLDPKKLTIKISKSEQVSTLAIRLLSEDTSELIIVGSVVPGQKPQTTKIVDEVMRLCNALGKDCKLAD
jgi:hypothetical protein